MAAIEEVVPALVEAREVVGAFQTMVRGNEPGRLEGWFRRPETNLGPHRRAAALLRLPVLQPLRYILTVYQLDHFGVMPLLAGTIAQQIVRHRRWRRSFTPVK